MKGLGSILTELQMEKQRIALKNGEAIACPLCGRIMEFNGVAWFCYAEECYPVRERLYAANPYGSSPEDLQGMMLAAILNDDGVPVVTFYCVRGDYGSSVFTVGKSSVSAETWKIPLQQIPHLVKDGEWVWQEWIFGTEQEPVVIVTRHYGLVAWLEARGITGTVIAQASADDVRGKNVIGALPFHLAALANSVTVVDMPGLRQDQRGKDLTPEEMDAAGATLSKYIVSKVENAQ